MEIIYKQSTKPAEFYKIGDVLLIENTQNRTTYLGILAQVAPEVINVICLEDGNRFSESMPVRDIRSITLKEMQDFCGEGYTFSKVSATLTVEVL